MGEILIGILIGTIANILSYVLCKWIDQNME